jgi:hypothetical protein
LVEGDIPFYVNAKTKEDTALQNELERYLGERKVNAPQQKSEVNEKLRVLELPLIPDDVAFGRQAAIEYFHMPVKQGVASGRFIVSSDGAVRRNPVHHPIDDFVSDLNTRGSESMKQAMLIGSLDSGRLEWSPLGLAGHLLVKQAYVPAADDGWIVLYLMVDPKTNQNLFVRAVRCGQKGPERVIETRELDRDFRERGWTTPDGQGCRVPYR